MNRADMNRVPGYTVIDVHKPTYENLCPLCRGWDGFATENDRPWWKGTPERICMEVLGWCFQVPSLLRAVLLCCCAAVLLC